jgi:quinohemoprotein amine dehydrogenase
VLRLATIVLFVAAFSMPALAQRGGRGGSPSAAASAPEPGIPVFSEDVQQACGTCHALDDKKMMSRISYRRASPENWELTVRRMIALNGLDLSPEQARRIIKDLADNHGLAPEEARPAAFEAERRLIDWTYTADRTTTDVCSRCHSMGRVISERRTSEEWSLLLAMHRGYYPGVDSSGGFRRGARGGGGGGAGATAPGAAPDNRQPMDIAHDHLAKTFPLQTPEWSAWSAAMRSPKLVGRWALSGYQIGRGAIYGEVRITEQPGAPDSFLTEARLVYAKTGTTETRRSRGIVYTGFQWRGRSADATTEENTWREVAFIDRDWNQIDGRWFTGAYDEIGIDVTLRRVSADPVVLGTNITSIKRSTTGRTVQLFGANLPARLTVADVDFGQGVKVTRIVSATPTMATVDVDVAADARVGPRDLWLSGATKTSALTIFDKVDGIKIVPDWGMARVGGVVFPKQLQQFEARAVSYGPDGKPDTKDDLDLGAIDGSWSLDEYPATFKDDDVKFVGELSAGGLFIPNVDGPNPQRSGNRNNVGDVWVVASYTPDGTKAALKARAHLLVTEPLYLNWEPKQMGLGK